MKISTKSILAIATATVLSFSCEESGKQETAQVEEESHGIDLHYMDTTVSPKQDFYTYVNGVWMDETDIPEDRKSWGSFIELRKKTDDNVLHLLNDAIDNNQFEAGSDQSKAIYLFDSQLDTTARNEAGLSPIKPTMEKIEEISDIESLQKILSDNIGEISNPFYGVYASAKLEESSMNGANLSGGSLGLPDRDYYTNEGADAEKTRQQYVDHITRMFKYLGDDQDTAKDKAERILALETKMAVPQLTKEEKRDANNRNSSFASYSTC